MPRNTKSNSSNKNGIRKLKHEVSEKDFTFKFNQEIEFNPRNERQAKAWDDIDNNTIVIQNGNAGTGKTFLAIAKALSLLSTGKWKKIVLLRPASLDEDEQLGFLSGDMQEKISPLILPLTSSIESIIGKENLEIMMEKGIIQGFSLAHVQGVNYRNDTIVILDEYQNAKAKTLKMLMSRMWDKSRLIICGDPQQITIPENKYHLSAALDINRYKNKRQISMINYSNEDIVRSNICKIVDSCWEDDRDDEGYYITDKGI